MQNPDLILTLTIGLAAALILGYLMQRLRLSPVAGYLLAGTVVGPNTPGVVANHELASQMADIGIVLLMFGVGLQFNFKKLLGVQRLVLPGATLQSLITATLGTVISHAFGLDWRTSIMCGLCLSVASTVALTRAFAHAGKLQTPAGNVAVGWLVIEDLLTVLIMVLLPAIFGPGTTSTGAVAWTVTVSLFKIISLIFIAFVLGGRFIPWLLGKVAATRSRELFTLAILVMALGIAVSSTAFFGVSMALGAFLGGMVVGRSDFSMRAATEALPMRDAFAVLFFVSVGMLFDPTPLIQNPGFVAATLGLVLVSKPFTAFLLTVLLGYPSRIALTMAFGLAQIGEFSFILAGLGNQLGILDRTTGSTLVVVSILSLSLNPLLLRMVSPLDAWFSRHPRLWRILNQTVLASPPSASIEPVAAAPSPPNRAVIVGYGPIGQTLTRLLRKNGVAPTLIEMNLDTVHHLRAQSIPVIYGDARHSEILRHAGVDQAATLILSSPSITSVADIIRHARDLNPAIRVLTYVGYIREQHLLEEAGATQAFSGEAEVALAMTESILLQLGAPPEQVERERARLRNELLNREPPVTPRVLPAMKYFIDGHSRIS